jgi:hypothetical protein
MLIPKGLANVRRTFCSLYRLLMPFAACHALATPSQQVVASYGHVPDLANKPWLRQTR